MRHQIGANNVCFRIMSPLKNVLCLKDSKPNNGCGTDRLFRGTSFQSAQNLKLEPRGTPLQHGFTLWPLLWIMEKRKLKKFNGYWNLKKYEFHVYEKKRRETLNNNTREGQLLQFIYKIYTKYFQDNPGGKN